VDANCKGLWFYLQTLSAEEKNSALDLFPEQSLNSAFKINYGQCHLLQLLLHANNSSFEMSWRQGIICWNLDRTLFWQEIWQGFKRGDRNFCLQPTAWPCSSPDKLKYSSWTVSSSSWPSEHKTGSSLGVLNHLLARLPAPSSGSFLSSKKISYMALQRSSKTRERSSSCYTTFHCFGQQRLAWLVGEHIVCPQYCCTLFQASSYRQPLSHW